MKNGYRLNVLVRFRLIRISLSFIYRLQPVDAFFTAATMIGSVKKTLYPRSVFRSFGKISRNHLFLFIF
ncbi:MAG TPA: hypothetical protein DDW43_03710 [Nitrosomonas sp.]|nr:hypothetical protein [Nitrosomonas sp.]